MKAANLDRALADHPELRWVDTANAESKPWMLAINDALGDRPLCTMLVLQGPAAGVREHLDGA